VSCGRIFNDQSQISKSLPATVPVESGEKTPKNLTYMYVTMCTLDNGRSPASNMLPVTDLVSWCMLHEDTMIIYCPLFIKQIQPVKYKLPYTQWQTLS